MLNEQKTVRWKRFTRASYAAFNSLHKEIAIGVLSVAMLQSAGLKAKTHSVAVNGMATIMATGSQDDDADTLSVSIGDVEVLGTRVPLQSSQAPRMVTVLSAADITAAAVHSINDLLEYAVGVDVRQRGEMGVQTDISVRGGTFDQITLMLNGINISSSHTGHLSADFPLSMDDIERIEIVEGPAARVFGTSAFTGAINIVTKSISPSMGGGRGEASIHLRGGSYGYASGDARLTGAHGIGAHGVMSHSLSGGYSRADGATPNSDFTNTHFFYNGQYSASNLKLSAQAGYSYKPYGANTFYGASSTDQWESNERWMAAVKAETKVGAVHIAPQAYWNRWYDHYQWHRGVSPGGENYHQVDVYGLGVNAWIESRWGKTAFGAEMRHDAIWSTNLGRPLDEDEQRETAGHDGTPDRKYTRHDKRTELSAFIEHNILLRQWTISVGLLTTLRNHSLPTGEGWGGASGAYPGLDISYRPTDRWKLYASLNTALRLPTYTDLYYSGANIEGNSDLSPEKTTDLSFGTKYRATGWDIQAEVFYSHKTDMIDWVVYADETVDKNGSPTDPKTWIYRSGNFRLNNIGTEMQASFMPRELWGDRCPLRRLSARYAYISEDMTYEREVALSKYAQEYLRHKVVLQADGRLWRNLSLSLSWRWQDRIGKGNNPYALLDGRLSWDMQTSGIAKHITIYADCTNILDKTYYDYSIVRQPGRWGKVGVVLSL